MSLVSPHRLLERLGFLPPISIALSESVSTRNCAVHILSLCMQSSSTRSDKLASARSQIFRSTPSVPARRQLPPSLSRTAAPQHATAASRCRPQSVPIAKTLLERCALWPLSIALPLNSISCFWTYRYHPWPSCCGVRLAVH